MYRANELLEICALRLQIQPRNNCLTENRRVYPVFSSVTFHSHQMAIETQKMAI